MEKFNESMIGRKVRFTNAMAHEEEPLMKRYKSNRMKLFKQKIDYMLAMEDIFNKNLKKVIDKSAKM